MMTFTSTLNNIVKLITSDLNFNPTLALVDITHGQVTQYRIQFCFIILQWENCSVPTEAYI